MKKVTDIAADLNPPKTESSAPTPAPSNPRTTIGWREPPGPPPPSRHSDRPPTTGPTKPDSLTATDIERLWVCMGEIYGMTWETNYGQKDGGMWLVGLQGLSWPDLLRGVECCIETPSQYPVNLPTFKQYCQPGPRLPIAQRLPKPWANRALVEKSLAECHAILQRETTGR